MRQLERTRGEKKEITHETAILVGKQNTTAEATAAKHVVVRGTGHWMALATAALVHKLLPLFIVYFNGRA